MKKINKLITVILSTSLVINSIPTDALALRPIAYKTSRGIISSELPVTQKQNDVDNSILQLSGTNSEDQEKPIKQHSLLKRCILILLSGITILFSVWLFSPYKYSVPPEFDDVSLANNALIELLSDDKSQNVDYSKKFPWFSYMEQLSNSEDIHDATVANHFIAAYGHPRDLATNLVRLEELRNVPRHLVPMVLIEDICRLREIPDEYIDWIKEISGREEYGISPEMIIAGMIETTHTDYSIGHGLDILGRRKNGIGEATNFLKKHLPDSVLELTFDEKFNDIIAGVVLEAKASMGIFQLRSVTVRRYLRTLDGKRVSEMFDRAIALALLKPKINIEAYVACARGVIDEVDALRKDALLGAIPDPSLFYRESSSEAKDYGGMILSVDNYSRVPSKEMFGKNDWALTIYHPLYYLKYMWSLRITGLVIISGVLDDKPIEFVGTPSQKDIVVLESLLKSNDLKLREAAERALHKTRIKEEGPYKGAVLKPQDKTVQDELKEAFIVQEQPKPTMTQEDMFDSSSDTINHVLPKALPQQVNPMHKTLDSAA